MKKLNVKEISLITIFIGMILISVNFIYFSDIPELFTTLNLVTGIIVAGVPLLYKYVDFSKKKGVEAMFPKFLQDVTENIGIGMTLPQAIRSTLTTDYGILSGYVKEISAKISWGIPFEKALTEFGNKIGSSSLKRTIHTIIETHKSGGKIDTVLESVVTSIQQLENIKRERSSSIYSQMITGYMIYVIFLGVMIGLSSFLIPAFRFEEAMPDMKNMFHELFRSLIIIQGLFAGLSIGKMAEGTLMAGVKHAMVLVILGYSAFVIFG